MKTVSITSLHSWKTALLTLLLALLLPAVGGQAKAASPPSAIPWARLPYYLASRGIAPDQKLPLCDCPRGLNEKNPTHHIVQVIANTLYEWREYRFPGADGKPRLALIMSRPQPHRLTAAEARILLTASATWQAPVPAGNRATVAAPNPRLLSRMPILPPKRSASAPDPGQPEVIPPVVLEQFPCNTIACLDISDSDKAYRGTGFQVSPYCFLTAGHNLYWEDHWVDSIRVIPAQHTGNFGNPILKPYGDRLCPQKALRTNTAFLADSGNHVNISEFDYGAILLEEPFPEIGTFMPLEFHSPGQSLPARTEIAGYPLYPYPDNPSRASNDPWRASGATDDGSPGGTYSQFIRFTTTVFGGNSGSPICYRDPLDQVRVIGITTWRNLTKPGGGGVLLTTMNQELIRGWLTYTPEFSHTSYIPYFCNRPDSWTGIALANPGDDSCRVKIEYFTPAGKPAGHQSLELNRHGQAAFACNPNQDPYSTSGWLKVSSTRPVYGLALVGASGTMSTMFDMELKKDLHQEFLFPHLASLTREKWSSTVMVCNPDPQNKAELTFIYREMDGTPTDPRSATVPANGSKVIDIGQLFGRDLENGSLGLSSSRPLAAFLLYDNTATGTNHWKAGLSAVPLD